MADDRSRRRRDVPWQEHADIHAIRTPAHAVPMYSSAERLVYRRDDPLRDNLRDDPRDDQRGEPRGDARSDSKEEEPSNLPKALGWAFVITLLFVFAVVVFLYNQDQMIPVLFIGSIGIFALAFLVIKDHIP